MASSCLHCGKSVRAKQHALCCDGCNRWQHRLCDTGISRSLYAATMRGEGIVTWHCRDCTAPSFVGDTSSIAVPAMESTRLEAPIVSSVNLDWIDDDLGRDEEVMESEEREEPHHRLNVTFDVIQENVQAPIVDEPEDDNTRLDASFDIIRENVQAPDDMTALDASFDIDRREARPEDPIRERSIQEPSVADDTILPPSHPTYEVIEKGSKRGGKLLVRSDGITYNVKRQNKSTTMWKCSVRSKTLICPATVLQRGENEFVTGSCNHVHPADPKLPYKVKVSAEAKHIAATNVFRPAMSIVEDVIMRIVPEEERFLAPKMDLLKRSSNLHRSKVRPTEPRDTNFELNLGYINSEEFLVKDVNEEGCRHIILATKYQLQLLAQTRCWYMDGTFKVVPDFLKPRGQLLSIHGFVRRDGKEQQFPLLFVLMSSRQEAD